MKTEAAAKFAPGPWEYNDPERFEQGHGRFSETAVYAAGNAFPWRMAEIQGPNEATEIATARLIAAAPDLFAFVKEIAKQDPVFAKGAEKQVIADARALVAKAVQS